MFKRLRLQLTAICALGSAVVLVGMAAVSLRFSLAQLERQSAESFSSNVSTVLFHLRTQPVLDQYWLAQTEADNNLWVRVESETAGLRFTAQNADREKLTAAALEHATAELSFAPGGITRSMEPETVLFQLEKSRYHGCVAVVPRENGYLVVTIVKSRAADHSAARTLVAGFAACVVVAVGLLVAFAWFFSARATRPVEESHRRQNAFVSAASHELRSPLAVIEMSAGTIRAVPAHAQSMAGKIEAECRRMARLISDLLFLASADSGRNNAHPSDVSARTMLLTVLERYELLATECGISLSVKLEPDLTRVFCDRQQTEQVLSIFMDNALRFTPKGGEVLLRGWCQRAHVCLSVADSGPGVPDDQKPLVFERFYRADDSRTDKEHYGLGLSIARQIAAGQGGKVSVRDSGAGGAEFILHLRRQGPSA